jgi:glycerophosphoryl diester phosphodiesterase
VLAPENSLVALSACASDYIEWAQVEIRTTKDGKHVVIHDDRVDGCSNGKGNVADLTLEELKQLDAGSYFAPRFKTVRFSSLPEALSAAKGKVNLLLECKQADPELLVKEISAAEMERQVIASGPPELMGKVSAASGQKIPIMIKFRPGTMTVDSLIKDANPAAVEMDAEDVRADLCKAFHDKGIRVQATVVGEKRDSAATWGKMLDAGVDQLLTDDPAGLRFTEVRRRVPKFPVMISYHRGANRYAPENTVASLEKAAALGADYIEFDIRPTKDGKYMLLHDSTLDRTTSARGPIRDAVFDTVSGLSAGAWFGRPFAEQRVPTLHDALTAVGKKSHAYLDAKDITPEHLLEAMRKFDLVERSVVYQSVGYLEKLKALEPKSRALPPLRRADQFESVAKLAPYAFDTNWSILSRDLIERAHKAGIKVFSDAMANEQVDQYLRAMGWGIDLIQTDHPLRVLRAIELYQPKSP